MVKKLIGVFLFSIPLLLTAQVSLTIQLPPAGMIQKDQLWNLVLMNNSNASLDITVLLNLRDAVTGQPVLSGGSRSITLAKGVKTLNVKDVQPVQYNFGTSGFNSNYLPLGAYIACYTLTKANYDAIETIAYECVNININPLSPPLLNTPADKSILQTPYPQFSWTPPTPPQMFDNLNYEITVAEIQEGQSPADAVRYNTPTYVKTNSKQPFETYPSSYSKLDTGKTYAWQVIARNGFNYAATTEVWTFGFSKDSAKLQNTGTSYILLKSNRDEAGVNYIEGNNLFIKYYSFDKAQETTVRFLNMQGRVIRLQKQKLIYGDNFIRFALNRQFKQGQVYRIEITDQQNKIHTATFSIK